MAQKLPIGIESFEEIRREDFYYVDKRLLIRGLFGQAALERGGLDKACEEALKQIKDRRYDEKLRNDGGTEIRAYGIAFCKKRCKVVSEILETEDRII